MKKKPTQDELLRSLSNANSTLARIRRVVSATEHQLATNQSTIIGHHGFEEISNILRSRK